MKKLFLFFALCAMTSISSAQNVINYFPGEKNAHIDGGKNGKNYAMILETKADFKTLVDKVGEFVMKYELYKDKSQLEKNLTEFSASQTDFTIRDVQFPFGYHAGGIGNMLALNPVVLTADLRFEIHDNGKIMVVLENLGQLVFMDLTTLKKSLVNKRDKVLLDEIGEEDAGQLLAAAGVARAKNNKFLKVITAFTHGIEGYKEIYSAIDDFYNDMNKQYKLLDKIASASDHFFWADGQGMIDTCKEIIDQDDMYYSKGTTLKQLEKLQEELNSGKLINVENRFWTKEIKIALDYFFKYVQASMDAKILGVAEDGEQTWDLFDGKLLPKDEKLRKTLIKKNLDYFSYQE